MTCFRDRTAVLFDLDGTLVDSLADIAAALSRTLAEEGLAPLPLERVRELIGDGAAVLVARAHQALGVDAPLDALARFKAHYEATCLASTACFAGMDTLVRDLDAAGRVIAVVTNKPTAFARMIVDGVGLGAIVRAVIGPELVRERKPSPLHVLDALATLGREPREAVIVGDGPTDVASGRDAGVATIAAGWGYRPLAVLEVERPDAVARDVAALRELLIG